MSSSPWLGGQRVTAERLSNMLNKFSDFTPSLALSGAGTPPAYGNAVLACRYSRSGDLITAHYDIAWGSTSTFGTAGVNWRIGLPVTAAATTQATGVIFCQASNAKRYATRARFTTTGAFEMEISSGGPDAVALTAAQQGIADSDAPFTWAANNVIRGVIRYEAA